MFDVGGVGGDGDFGVIVDVGEYGCLCVFIMGYFCLLFCLCLLFDVVGVVVVVVNGVGCLVVVSGVLD